LSNRDGRTVRISISVRGYVQVRYFGESLTETPLLLAGIDNCNFGNVTRGTRVIGAAQC
jgi:hypothetical protein